ncbi:MAG: hypothetical protein JRF61_22090 [Deltaproteobacteria bacterium]|nr:hypothetical protein [Deltaproteobacteria bacterium]
MLSSVAPAPTAADPANASTSLPAAPSPLARAAIAARPAEVWQTIRYRGHNWLGRFSAELELHAPGAPATAPSTSAPGPHKAAQQAGWVAELRAQLDSFLLADKQTRIRATFDPVTGAVSRFTKLSLGPRPDLKTYEFAEGGVERLRVQPDVGQASLAPEQWSKERQSFHPYDAAAHGCRVVSDPGAMAYWLTWGPAAGRELVNDPGACFFWGKTLYRVDFRHLGAGSTRVDYRIVRDGRSAHRSGRVRVERYEAIARPVAGEMEETPTRSEIVLEAESRLPWRFVTHEGPMQIDVELREVVLGDPLLLAGRDGRER